MKKLSATILMSMLILSLITGCSTNPTNSSAATTGAVVATPIAKDNFDTGKSINVVSREEGSGTRGAFIELFGIEVKAADGTKTDTTTKEAVIADKTDVMLTGISSDTYGIGYISLGSLHSSVKAIEIDGARASSENIKNGSYTISRPFNIATKGEATGLAKDFIDFILSAEGQTVVAKSYIAMNQTAPAYTGSKPAGKIAVGGSSSVSPIMQKLIEAYKLINPNATIELQESDSGTGVKGATDGTFEIGMASRALKDSEKENLTEITIAIDGIAVIVSNQNTATTNLTKDQVKAIFTGEALKWSDLSE